MLSVDEPQAAHACTHMIYVETQMMASEFTLWRGDRLSSLQYVGAERVRVAMVLSFNLQGD